MIMGRKRMETLSSFDFAPEQWPYGDAQLYVLSNMLQIAPRNMAYKVEGAKAKGQPQSQFIDLDIVHKKTPSL